MSEMFFLFKLFIINIILLPSVLVRSNEYLNIQDKIHRGMSSRNIDIENWAMDALSYNTNVIHSLKEIYDYLKLLAACPYGHVKLQNLTIKKVRARLDAITEMGNYIPYLNISVGSYVQKPAIIIIGGIMGCHWLTVAASINLAKEFAVYYDVNYEHTSRVTWIIIPVLNPDGYNITLTNKNMRNWKKNLAKPPSSPIPTNKEKNCFGVDLCMNFEYQWISYNYKNSSWCDDNYADKPFSQNESKAIRDTVADHLDTAKIFIQLKQEERLFMYPFRYTSLQPIFWKVYDKIVKAAAKVATKKYNREFQYGHVSKFRKQTAGELDDWVMAHLGVSLGFTYEVAEWSNNDKPPSKKEIEWTNNEIFAALKVTTRIGVRFDEMGFLPSIVNGCNIKKYILNILIIFLLQILYNLT